MPDHRDQKRPAGLLELPRMLDAQHVEVTGCERERAGEAPSGFQTQDFASCVHAGADSSQSSNAAAATWSAVTRVIQRWSIGHSRSRQGLHLAGARTTRASGPVGPVVV